MANTVNVVNIDPQTFTSQEYNTQDIALISNFTINDIFDKNKDYIEYFVFDLNQNILYPNQNYTNYSINNNNIVIDPQNDIQQVGFEEGQYNTLYNFFTKILNSSQDNKYYISEISSDRTELRLSSNVLDNLAIQNGVNEYLTQKATLQYYPDFYLNFGNNNLIIANNVLLDNSTVLIKLYEPLPNEITLKTELWVVEKIANSLAYSIELIVTFNNSLNSIPLQGPNFNIPIKDTINNSTDYYTLNQLQSTSNLTGSNSLYYQLNSLMVEKGLEINIDYSKYSDFAHFSSVNTRLENFYYKLSLIETYTSQSITSSISTPNYYSSSSVNIWQNKINNIITNFDGYEYYLYYESGSNAWPKLNSTPPYLNTTTTSVLGTNWFNSQSISASDFDSRNDNNLLNTIPSYLRDDAQNAPYELFISMVAQHFDNIWVYYKDVTNKYSADNRLDYGISKDIVADAIRDFGVKLYQNNFSTNDLYSAFLGITPQGSLLPYTGSEMINTFITASATGSLIPLDDVNKEIYKRIYHNLPYLLKKKGTVEGLRALINIYGIPDTILRISEFGGKSKANESYDYWYNTFNYAWSPSGSNKGYVNFTWTASAFPSNPIPQTYEFRFKSPTDLQPVSKQILASIGASSYHISDLVLEYTGSWTTTSSYSGGIYDPYYKYGTLKYISGSASASVYLPFFDGGWWSLMVTQDASNLITLYAKNKIYQGEDGNKIGFQASNSIQAVNSWTYKNAASDTISFILGSSVGSLPILGNTYTRFTGSYQELRVYNVALSESIFNDFVMNPYSIEGNDNDSQSALNTLIFRAPLGTDLKQYKVIGQIVSSSHPAISSYPITNSFYPNLSRISYTANTTGWTFQPNYETIFQDSVQSGVKNRVSNKIKLKNISLPLSNSIITEDNNVLSPYISIQQNYPVSNSYTHNLNYLEVAFSPQNEVNDDIVAQLGYFNIGDYIGDPSQLSQSLNYYPDLNILRDNYFKKYTLGNKSNYNLFDYIRLIKYFDNSLFKMIKDFVPARTSLASGIVIKQHMLERNRYKLPPVSAEQDSYTGSIKIGKYSGGTGGSTFDLYSTTSSIIPQTPIIINQSWSESFQTPYGVYNRIHNNLDEFFNGEFSGSEIQVSKQSLLDPDCVKYLHSDLTAMNWGPILYRAYSGSYNIDSSTGVVDSSSVQYITNESTYLNSSNFPQQGSMSLWYNPGEPYVVYRQAGFPSYSIMYFLRDKNQGVRYITIPRIDANGVDQTVRLQQATDIRIKYNDIGSVSYPVSNITEYPTYYLYTIPYINTISSTDNEILNYVYSNYNNNGGNVPISTTTYFNAFKKPITRLPNALVTYTASIDWSITLPLANTNYTMNPIGIGIVESGSNKIIGNKNLTFTTSSLSPGSVVNGNITWSGSLNNYSSNNYTYQVMPYISNGQSDLDWSWGQIDINITQSQSPQTIISDLTIISPQIADARFETSECNPIYGNVDSYPLSQYFEEVNYKTGITIPTNYTQIIQNSAIKVAVKDYYYNLRRQTAPRYQGIRTTATDINTKAIANYDNGITGSFLVGNKISGSAVPGANVERYSNLFGVFNYITSASTDLNNDFSFYDKGINIDIQYLLDKDGNIIKVNDNEINLTQLFKPQNKARIVLFNSSSNGKNFNPTINDAGNRYQFIVKLNDSSSLWGDQYPGDLDFQIYTSGSIYNSNINGMFIHTQSYGYPLLKPSSDSKVLKWDTFKYNSYTNNISMFLVNPTFSIDYGDPNYNTSFTYINGSFRFYDKMSQQVIGINNTPTYLTPGFPFTPYPFKDTYLPIQPKDVIKITDFSSGSLSMYTNIIDISNTSSLSTSSAIYFTGSNDIPSNFTNMNGIKTVSFYRPYKSPTINVKNFLNKNYNGLGIILPSDYNPTLDYLSILKKAGIQ
jgi:hypothetical protein